MTQRPEPSTRHLDRRLGDAIRARLPHGLAEFMIFVLKQGWACLFGIAMLAGLIVSDAIWRENWVVARYDALLIYAVLLQVGFVWLKLETWQEVRVIALFHLSGTAMELFKVYVGSWSYPEPALMKLAGVPLFSGFMYASVGSYMARAIRIFEMRFAPYPPFWATVLLAVAIYVNFFSHRYVPDIRLLLFALTIVMFIRTRIWFRIGQTEYWMPLPLAAFFSSFFLWLAENVGTNTGTWIYAGDHAGFDWVSLSKMGSWYLLLYVSFVTVTLVYRDMLLARALTGSPASAGQRSTAPPSESG